MKDNEIGHTRNERVRNQLHFISLREKVIETARGKKGGPKKRSIQEKTICSRDHYQPRDTFQKVEQLSRTKRVSTAMTGGRKGLRHSPEKVGSFANCGDRMAEINRWLHHYLKKSAKTLHVKEDQFGRVAA